MAEKRRAAYLDLAGKGELAGRARLLRAMLGKPCRLCPRHCRVDRREGQLGVCRTADRALVASYGPHFGEEAPLVGTGGSGTIFFANCVLRCVFCQNYEISVLGEGGRPVEPPQLARIMLELQDQGCHNINLVTPTHVTPMILEGLAIAAGDGLELPLVYNCGGYEELEVLGLLDGVVDIYMPDMKYADSGTAQRLSRAADYPRRNRAAIREMHRQVGDLALDEDGVAYRGLLVRHLVLPGGLAGTGEIARFLAEEISADTYVNIMAQYRPIHRARRFPPLDRMIGAGEFREAVTLARDAGLHRFDVR
ncbi:MAG: radical SAM protein [bacterium]|nr:radical SAM protein [bacterium]